MYLIPTDSDMGVMEFLHAVPLLSTKHSRRREETDVTDDYYEYKEDIHVLNNLVYHVILDYLFIYIIYLSFMPMYCIIIHECYYYHVKLLKRA